MKNFARKIFVCIGLVASFMLAACGGGSSVDENAVGSEYSVESGTLRDLRDNQTYNVVVIGKQTWMAENLNYETESSVQYPDYDGNPREKYGRLYHWDEAMTVCPTGWRLPEESDWNALLAFIGDSTTAGTRLKATHDWDKHKSDVAGTDQYGFAALPGGASHVNGYGVRSFSDNGAFFWSATESSDVRAILFVMHFEKEIVESAHFPKETWLSVRCIKKD